MRWVERFVRQAAECLFITWTNLPFMNREDVLTHLDQRGRLCADGRPGSGTSFPGHRRTNEESHRQRRTGSFSKGTL